MRKIVIGAFVSLDGVMQAPGGPDEDPTGGFRFGGWIVPLWDDAIGAAIGEAFAQPFDLLLGRRTYDIFAAHWPHVQTDPAAADYDAGNADISRKFDAATKYVATHRPESLTWKNSRGLGTDIVATVRALKQQDGPPLLTQGSSELLHILLAADLVDELRLVTFPIVLGHGKRLFAGSAAPTRFRVTSSTVAPGGAVAATYERVGGVDTGSFAFETPTAAEVERRENLR